MKKCEVCGREYDGRSYRDGCPYCRRFLNTLENEIREEEKTLKVKRLKIRVPGILRKVRESRRKVKMNMDSPQRRASQSSQKSRSRMSSTAASGDNNEALSDDADHATHAQKGHKGAGLRRGHQEDMRLTVTLLVVIMVFVVCWLPFCVTMFLSVFSPTPVPRAADILTLLLGCFNSCCNPVIYGVMNRRFWNGYKKLYCCLCSNSRTTVNSDDLDQPANRSWRESTQ